MKLKKLHENFWQNKRVLVTGHTGFKGSWLIKWLDMLGADTFGYALPVDEFNVYGKLRFSEKHKSVAGDILNADILSAEVRGFEPEIVFHLAAQAIVGVAKDCPAETFFINAGGTVNLLEAVRKTSSLKSVVIVTSDKVYENSETFKPYTETSRFGGDEPYSASKACVELAVMAYRNAVLPKNIGVATARAANVYGGGDMHFDRLIPYLIKMKLENKTAEIRNKDSVRPWQHVLSPLYGYLLLAEALYKNPNEFSEGFNFGPPEDELFTVGEIAKLINGESILNALTSSKKFRESNILRIDSNKSCSRLDWKPVIGLQKGLENTIEFYRDMLGGKNVTDLMEKTIGGLGIE